MPKIKDETGNALINSIDSNPPSLESRCIQVGYIVCVWNAHFPCVPAFCRKMVGHMHCSRDPQVLFFFSSKNNFKTGFHDIIYTFKNYFAAMFSIFSNKWYTGP